MTLYSDILPGIDSTINLGSSSLYFLNIYSDNVLVADEAYGVAWDGSLEVPTKNAIYDKIEGLGFVDTAGTPVNNQVAVFTDANTIEGHSGFTYDSGTNLLALGGELEAEVVSLSNTGSVTPINMANSTAVGYAPGTSTGAMYFLDNAVYFATSNGATSSTSNNFGFTFSGLSARNEVTVTDTDLTYNGTSLLNSNVSLDDLTDVTISGTQVAGETIVWDGSGWVDNNLDSYYVKINGSSVVSGTVQMDKILLTSFDTISTTNAGQLFINAFGWPVLARGGSTNSLTFNFSGYTSARTVAWPDKDGTVAFTSDLPTGGAGGDYVDLTSAQTIGGAKTFSVDVTVPDEVYGVSWNGSLEVPTKNAVYDKIESIDPTGDYLLLSGASTMLGNLDIGGQWITDVDQLRFSDTDSDSGIWSMREITNANYVGDLAVGHIGVYYYAFSQTGTPTQNNHLVTKGYIDSNFLATTTNIADLNDTTITGAAKGDILVYNGSAWVDLTVGSNTQVLTANSATATGLEWAAASGGASALNELTDVTITAAATGEYLRYNGSSWVDSTIQASDIPTLTDYVAVAGDTMTGTLTFNNASNSGILRGADSQRMLIGGGSAWSGTSGAYIEIQGIDFGGVGLGGDVKFQQPSGSEAYFSQTVRIAGNELDIQGASPRIDFTETGGTNNWNILVDADNLDFRKNGTSNTRVRLDSTDGRLDLINGGDRFRLIGDSTGDTNVVYMSFYESNNTTRQAYIGLGTTANDDLYINSDVGDVRIQGASTRINNNLVVGDVTTLGTDHANGVPLRFEGTGDWSVATTAQSYMIARDGTSDNFWYLGNASGSHNHVYLYSYPAAQYIGIQDTGTFIYSGTNVNFSSAVVDVNDIRIDDVAIWYVSSTDTAHQRADARDDATTESRLHWYGVTSAGATSNFRHAWYDGTNYVNIDYLSDVLTWDSGTAAFGMTLRSAGDVTLKLHADDDNSGEGDNPTLLLSQDGDLVQARFSLEGDAGTTMSGTNANSVIFATNGTAYDFFWGTTTNGSVMNLDVSTGNVTANDFVLSSDRRLKDDILDLEPSGKPVRWRQFKMKERDDEEVKAGVIAQELLESYPQFVRENADGYLSVMYTSLFAAEFARKDKEIEELNNKIDKLEAMVQKLMQ